MRAINAGELNRRIQIIRLRAVMDQDGYEVPQEELVLGCWARVTKTSGTEMVKAGADFGQEKARFLIRRPSVAIDRKMLVKYEGKEWEVIYVNDYAGGQYVEVWGQWESNRRSAQFERTHFDGPEAAGAGDRSGSIPG